MKRHMASDYFYMAVTNDELELPIVSAETIEEFSKKVGVRVNTIQAYFTPTRYGRQKTGAYKYVRIKKCELEKCDT